MKTLLAATLHRLSRWLRPKYSQADYLSPWTSPTFANVFPSRGSPSPGDLLAELKNTAYACVSLNAGVCAAFPPKLYVATERGQARPKCLAKELAHSTERHLRQNSSLPARLAKAEKIEEVLEHPLLTLLRNVNQVHNAFDLWELTTLYQEVQGSAYWKLTLGPLGTPEEIWILPSQFVTPRREARSRNIVDYYEYRSGAGIERFDPDEIIHFRYPDPRDPYTAGLSPLRAAFESVTLSSEYLAFRQAKFHNRSLPDAIISPEESVGEAERDRLEAEWNAKFRRGGPGGVVIADNGLKVALLNQSLGDLAALADMRVTKEDIANAFQVPLAFLTSETNLANLQAAEHQHMAKAIRPRLQRRDDKINEQLIPRYDPTGRLFVAADDPVPQNAEQNRKQQETDLKYGVVTINEIRQQRGLPPVAWGEGKPERLRGR